MMDWVIAVDSNKEHLEQEAQILSDANMRVTSLHSGKELLDYVRKNEIPDLILLDLDAPEHDGFETMRLLKDMQPRDKEIPIIFLSSDESRKMEARGLRLGAVDFIKKPLVPETLLSRVQNAITTAKKMRSYQRHASIDTMTGVLNKAAAEAKIIDMCLEESGMLCVLDLDDFKLVNDFCGHDVGNQVLNLFSRHLKRNVRTNDVCGRIGGDEFIVFALNMKSEEDLRGFYRRISDSFVKEAADLFGSDMDIPIGLSIGGVLVPEQGRDYGALFRLADQALYAVKQNGKHGCILSYHTAGDFDHHQGVMDLETATSILEERNISPNAMWMGKEAFTSVYRYMVRYMERYHGTAYRVLFSVSIDKDKYSEMERHEVFSQFRSCLQKSLRNSDVMMDIGDYKLFLMLPEAHDYDISSVINRLMHQWNESKYSNMAEITYESGRVHLASDDEEKSAE